VINALADASFISFPAYRAGFWSAFGHCHERGQHDFENLLD
jgi:hypothetical protein